MHAACAYRPFGYSLLLWICDKWTILHDTGSDRPQEDHSYLHDCELYCTNSDNLCTILLMANVYVLGTWLNIAQGRRLVRMVIRISWFPLQINCFHNDQHF